MTYLYTDSFTNINPSHWTLNGSLSGSGLGLVVGYPDYQGSIISKYCEMSSCTGRHEIKSILSNLNNGYFVHYLNAAQTAKIWQPSVDAPFVSVSLFDTGYDQNSCAAGGMTIHQNENGTLTQLAYYTIPCRANMEIRTIMRADHKLLIYIDGQLWAVQQTSNNLWGSGGVGVQSTSGSIRSTSIGSLDQTAPGAPSQLRFSATSSSVDFQWRGAEDTGSGVLRYQVWRDGVYRGEIPTEAWTDATVAPATTYTYQFKAVDYHYNVGTAASVTVTTPAAGTKEPPRRGIRPLGTYWGAMGENIDLQSGNLNFTLPLLSVQGRAGMSVPVVLTYNSQNWRLDSNGTWILGGNVGVGFGWRLLAGSLTPYYSDYVTVHHYLFADASGAEYRLDQQSGTVWTTEEGVGVTYDSSTQRLWFNNGSFWEFGALSQGREFDAGTRYPTKMQDSNGNRILFRYNQGRNAVTGNSSSRIAEIEDPRTPVGQSSSYQFSYSTDSLPLLTGITNTLGTSESHTFTYLTNQGLTGPFATSPTLTTTSLLSGVSTQSMGSYAFTYGSNAAGELVKVTLPLGGELEWAYSEHQSSLGESTVR